MEHGTTSNKIIFFKKYLVYVLRIQNVFIHLLHTKNAKQWNFNFQQQKKKFTKVSTNMQLSKVAPNKRPQEGQHNEFTIYVHL